MYDNNRIVKWGVPKQCKNKGNYTYQVYEQQYYLNNKLYYSNYLYKESTIIK